MAAGRIRGITIEIDGDPSKLTTALSKVDRAISNTQRNIRDLEKALKLDPGNAALLKDKQMELAAEIDATKEKLKTEKEALDQLKNSDGFDATSEQARNLQTQIDLDTASLKQLEKEAQQSASVLGSQFQAAGQKIQEVGQKITEVGEKVARVGQDLTTKVTAPIVAGFTAAIKTTADFDEQMSKVKAIAGATEEEFDQLREKAREMGASTKFSATEAGEAFEYMAMAGWKTEDMMQGIDGIMNLAAASGEELGRVSDIVTDALTAFGMSANESGRFADILAAAATNANTNVSMMGESFKYVAPVAGSLGYTAEDVAIALGLMANSGIKADMAGTSLRNMFQRMAKPTKDSQAAMDRLGLSIQDDTGRMYSFREIMQQMRESFTQINIPLEEYNQQLDNLDALLADGTITQKKYDEELEELNKQAFGAEGAEKARAAAMLGGTRAMSGLLAIANATEEDFNNLTTAIDGSSGAAESMANTMLDNLNGQLTILKSQLQELAISFGDVMMPVIRQFVEHLQKVVDWLNSMDDAQREQIIKIAAIVAAVGPALLIIGKVIAAIGTIVSVIGGLVSAIGGVISTVGAVVAGLNPVVLIIAAIIAAVVALGVAVATHWEQVKEAFGKFKEWISPVVDAVKGFGSAIVEFVKAFVEVISEKIGGFLKEHETVINAWMITIKAIFSTGFEIIKTVVSTVLENIRIVFTTVFKVLENLVKAVTAIMKGDWSGAMEALKNAAKAAWDGIKAIFNNLKEGVGKIFNTLIENFKKWANQMIENLVNGIKDKIGNVKTTIQEGLDNAVAIIKDLPGKAFQWGADIIGGIVDGIKSMIDKVGEAASSIADKIREYIHFSTPDKGPLADFDSYMPDMANELVKGINEGIPKIENAMQNLSAAMVPVQNGKTVNNSNNINMTVYGAQGQSVEQLADVIQRRLNQQVYQNEAVFA